MKISTANWVGEGTTTIGTGSLSLGGALVGYCGFSSIPTGPVCYTIQDGFNRETGIGTIIGNVLERTNVQATLVDGIYAVSASPIYLTGSAQVFGTINADFLNSVADSNDVLKNITLNGTPLKSGDDISAGTLGVYTTTQVDAIVANITPESIGTLNATDINAAFAAVDVRIGDINAGSLGVYTKDEVDAITDGITPTSLDVYTKPEVNSLINNIDPNDINAYTKAQTNDLLNTKLDKNGGTVSGQLIVQDQLTVVDGTYPTSAVNLQQVNALIGNVTANSVGAYTSNQVNDLLAKKLDKTGGVGTGPFYFQNYPVTIMDGVDPEHAVTLRQLQDAGGFVDAPADGKIYGRKNEAWAEVTSGSGVGTVTSVDGIVPNAQGNVLISAARKAVANTFTSANTFNAGVIFNSNISATQGISVYSKLTISGLDGLFRATNVSTGVMQFNIGNTTSLSNITSNATPITTFGGNSYELYHTGNLPKVNPGYNGDLVYLSSVTSITDMNDIPTSRYLIASQELVLSGPHFGRKWANQPAFDDVQMPQIQVYLIETVKHGQNEFGTADIEIYQTITNYLAYEKKALLYRTKQYAGGWSPWMVKIDLFPSLPYNKFTDGALGTSEDNILLSQSASMGEYYTEIPVDGAYILKTISDGITKNFVFSFEFISADLSGTTTVSSLPFYIDNNLLNGIASGTPIASYSSLGDNKSLSGLLEYDGDGFILKCNHNGFMMTRAYINGPTIDEINELGIF